MNKVEFLTELKMRIESLPQADVDAAVDYYTELIDVAMDTGLSSVAAVARLDSPESIANKILETGVPRRNHADIHNKRESIYEKPKRAPKRKRKAWEWILLVLGTPLLLILLLLTAIVFVVLTIAAFALLLVLYVLDLALAVAALAGLIIGPFTAMINSSVPLLLLLLGLVFLSAGTSFLLFSGCKSLTIQLIRLYRYFFHRRRAKFHERRTTV